MIFQGLLFNCTVAHWNSGNMSVKLNLFIQPNAVIWKVYSKYTVLKGLYPNLKSFNISSDQFHAKDINFT